MKCETCDSINRYLPFPIKLAALTVIFLCFTFYVSGFKVFAAAGAFNIGLTVEGAAAVCDNDGVCEAGENAGNCPQDCGCNNNGVCESARGETENNCPGDCYTGGGGGYLPDETAPTIYDIKIENITLTSAYITWKTTEQAYCDFYFGQTTEYEIALVEGDKFVKEHQTGFDGLSESTLYNFKIACRDKKDNQRKTDNLMFSTLTPPDITPPPNVDDFTAQGKDSQIDLDWQNPFDDDFEDVLVVKSEDFYPQKPWEGEPIYFGKSPIIEDTDVVNDKTYYYTAFSYDKNGNYSSGAVASAVPGKEEPPEPPVKPPVEPPPPEVEKLKIEDFSFFQSGKLVPLSETGAISITDEPLTILIDYDKVPEVLKTIMVSLEKDSKYFSFLLKINDDKTRYEAVIMAPEPGQYPLSIYVLDYKNQALKVIKGSLKVEGTAKIISPSKGWKQLLTENYWLVWLLIILLVIILSLVVVKIIRKRKKGQNAGQNIWPNSKQRSRDDVYRIDDRKTTKTNF